MVTVTCSLNKSATFLALRTKRPKIPNKNKTNAILSTTEKYEEINLRF